MSFLKKIAKDHKVEISLKDKIHQALAGVEKARSVKVLHASDLTKEDPVFCPRKMVLHRITKTKPKDSFVGTSLRYTFDIGDILQQKLSDSWVVDHAIGDWKCVNCKTVFKFQKKPHSCGSCGCLRTEYQEVRFKSQNYSISGGVDLIVDLGAAKYTPIEVKTIDKDQFKKLEAPLSEHRIRTNLYMKVIEDSDHPYKQQIDTGKALVFYMAKAFGIKDETLKQKGIKDAGFSPFKEYLVKRNDDALEPYLDKAKKVHDFNTGGIIPDGVCPSIHCNRAMSCEIKKECFSSHFPVGGIYSAE